MTAESLCSELQSSWSNLANLIDGLSEVSSSLRHASATAKSLRETREQYEVETRSVLVEPVRQFLRIEPIRRSLEAIEQYDRESAGGSRARAGIDRRFQSLLARAAMDLCEPWRIRRRGANEDEWRDWNQRRALYGKEASELLGEYAVWARNAGANNEKDDSRSKTRFRRSTARLFNDPTTGAFLGALASAALAIGLGLQDLIKNLIGGLVIVTDRPYQIGDRVRLGEAYGEVVQIGLRSTKILTADGVLATVPNSEVLTHLTFNASGGAAESMILADVSLPHEANPDQIMQIGREVAVCCLYTHLDRPIEVQIDDKGPGGRYMKLSIKAHVYDHRFEGAMQTDMLRRAKRELLACGVLRRLESGGEGSPAKSLGAGS